MTRYEVHTVDGDRFGWVGELPITQSNDVSMTIKQTWLVCPNGTLVNLAHVIALTPLG